MAAKVFISCGQASEKERDFATKLSKWFKRKKYEPYVAIESQSIMDVNNAIIWNLRTADYYIFIDNKREQLLQPENTTLNSSEEKYRGSLFTHQELAMSYLINFPETIFLQQEGMHLEGLLKYVLGNPKRFINFDDALRKVIKEVGTREWTPEFSRAFKIEWVPLYGPCTYSDRSTGDVGRYCRIGKLNVKNMRVDIPAINTIARLEGLTKPDGSIVSPDQSNLKWAGMQEYEKLIFENEDAAFDAFSILESNPLEIYLHSATDFGSGRPIITGPTGKYLLQYSIASVQFPKTEAIIELDLTGNINTTNVKLIASGHFGTLKHTASNSRISSPIKMIDGENAVSGTIP